MNLLTQWQARWANMSPREQRLMLAALALVLGTLLWWVALAPAMAVLKAAPAQHAALDAQLQHMQRLQAQAKSLQAQAVLSSEQARLALELALKPLGAGAQLNVQADRVTITLKAISAENLARLLATARQNAHAVPSEAHLARNPQDTWDGTLVLNVGARP